MYGARRTTSGRWRVVPDRVSDERGFGLIELVVAMVIMSMLMLALSYVFSRSLTAVAFERQRQSAQSLANQTLEQIRALPFATVSRGLDSADSTLASDPNITTAGSVRTLTFNSINETIPVGTGGTTQAPLIPHQRSVQVGVETFTVRAYITNYLNDPASQKYRAVVVVSWADKFHQGTLARSITTESILFSSGGCVSSATHPFAAPCQPFLYSTASVDTGFIRVTGVLSGVALDQANLLLANTDATIQVEQVSSTQGLAQTSGASIGLSGQTVSSVGSAAASSGADNDPASTSPVYSSASASQGAIGPLTVSDAPGHNSLTVSASAGDTASTASTPSASATNSCQDFNNAAQTNGLPCSSSRSQQAGTMTASARFWSGGDDFGTLTLASLAAAPSATRVFATRVTAPGGSYCANTISGGDGCIHARSTRSIGTLSLGGLPSTLTGPAGWAGYFVRLSGYSDTATAESGAGSVAPTIALASPAPALSYWNGTGYSSLSIAAGTGVTIPATTFDATWIVDGEALQIQMIPNLTTGGTSTVDSAGSPCTCTRTVGTATVASPLVGTIRYVLTYKGNVLDDLTLTVNLGSTLANTSYQAAPSAG